MILSRFAHLVREQQWFMVGTEFFIVVLGIFLGLQVTSWNDTRLEHVEEARLIGQLRAETFAAINLKRTNIQISERSTARLLEAILIIQDLDEESVLDADQCRAIWQSNAIFLNIAELVTVDEILNSNLLRIFRDHRIRAALLKSQNWRTRALSDSLFLRDTMINMIQEFPDILPSSIDPATGYEQAECQLGDLRDNPAALNALIGNLARARGIADWHRYQLENLQELSTLLDTEDSP
jgi:hypothetical protein